jgi:antitoxin HicB
VRGSTGGTKSLSPIGWGSEEEGGGYLIEFPDYPGCIADGETPEEAMTEGRDALTAYIRTLEELGRAIPNPKSDAFSGQWRLRVPRSMHAALARRADREGVSLNSLVTAMLAEGLGRRDVRDWLEFGRTRHEPTKNG